VPCPALRLWHAPHPINLRRASRLDRADSKILRTRRDRER
jgi:hypothetical protein